MPAPRRTMSRAFRKRMLRQAAMILAGLVAVLLVLVGTLGEKAFLIAALVLCPAAAIVFNLTMRRAYAAQSKNSR